MAGIGGNMVSCGKGIDVGTALGAGATAVTVGAAGDAGVVGIAGTIVVGPPVKFVAVGGAMVGIGGAVTTGGAAVGGVICGVTCVIGTLLSEALPVPFCAFTLLIPSNPKNAVKTKTIFFILLLFNYFFI
jgi:hypothetical protein